MMYVFGQSLLLYLTRVTPMSLINESPLVIVSCILIITVGATFLLVYLTEISEDRGVVSPWTICKHIGLYFVDRYTNRSYLVNAMGLLIN